MLQRRIQSFEFNQAREDLAAQSLDAPQKEQLLKEIAEVESLFQWTQQQVNRGGTLPSPLMRSGTAFKSDPIKADERNLFVKVSNDTPPIPIAWKEISPLYLIKMVQFRLPALGNPTQQAELLWRAGTVHLLMGSSKNAKPFLEEAARLNPAFAELLQARVPAEPTP